MEVVELHRAPMRNLSFARCEDDRVGDRHDPPFGLREAQRIELAHDAGGGRHVGEVDAARLRARDRAVAGDDEADRDAAAQVGTLSQPVFVTHPESTEVLPHDALDGFRRKAARTRSRCSRSPTPAVASGDRRATTRPTTSRSRGAILRRPSRCRRVRARDPGFRHHPGRCPDRHPRRRARSRSTRAPRCRPTRRAGVPTKRQARRRCHDRLAQSRRRRWSARPRCFPVGR